jgi:NMD protein affecting ribosome stability and mRNA decay
MAEEDYGYWEDPNYCVACGQATETRADSICKDCQAEDRGVGRFERICAVCYALYIASTRSSQLCQECYRNIVLQEQAVSDTA